MRYFSYDAELDYMRFHTTAEAAQECAQRTLASYRRMAVDDGEWSEDAGSICWGEVREIAQPTISSDENGNEFTEFALYPISREVQP